MPFPLPDFEQVWQAREEHELCLALCLGQAESSSRQLTRYQAPSSAWCACSPSLRFNPGQHHLVLGDDCSWLSPSCVHASPCRLGSAEETPHPYLLDQPLVLTTKKLSSEVDGTEGFEVVTVEQVEEGDRSSASASVNFAGDTCPGVLMLTSGSFGNAKAVELEPAQIFASMHGKHKQLDSRDNDIFLNWIGFDHVANLTETHLLAMYLSADQHHAPAADVISDVWLFVRLISEYRVTANFAPNFFLAGLLQALDGAATPPVDGFDLSCLRRIQSGGEANLVDTAARLTNALQKFHADKNIIHPGFGMTETCAGSIYSRNCPSYDVKRNHEFATLGHCVPGIQMRIMKDDGPAGPNEISVLQVTGPIVFNRYYNNATATAEAFTADGWFSTGDKAIVDENGNLCLSGRDKEIINLNGVKCFPHELETALEEGGIEGIVRSYTAIFSIRPYNAQQEDLCVLYHPAFGFDETETRIRTADAITQVVGVHTSSRPKHIVPLPTDLFPKSALGKLSRAKLRKSLERGEFRDYEDGLNDEIKRRREAMCEPPSTETEKLILRELSTMLAAAFVDAPPVGVNNSIFDLGVTSTDLFLLGHRVQNKLNIDKSIPVGTFLTDPTIRGIAAAIDELQAQGTSEEYVPIVPLQKEGDKAPLFLVHPGSGNVLIFVALAKYFPDRPVYGIRTRCLYAGEDYHKHILSMAMLLRAHQEDPASRPLRHLRLLARLVSRVRDCAPPGARRRGGPVPRYPRFAAPHQAPHRRPGLH